MPLMLAATLGVSKASAETISGSAALALAGVVAATSPVLTSVERKAVDELFAGSSDISYKKKIAVTADKIVCRAGNVDITSRSCELTSARRPRPSTAAPRMSFIRPKPWPACRPTAPQARFSKASPN